MRPCPPSEFVRRWPGALRPIVFPDPPPALPDDDVHCLREYGLPRELTIHCHNDITLTFSGSLTPLAEVWDRDSKLGHQMGDMPDAWRRFWHLADQEYCQGGGWVCIEEETARLVVIDLDQSGPIYVLNGNMGDFYTTLAHFLDWSEKSDGSPAETAILRDALLSQDCISPDDLEDFWMNFIWAALDGDPIELAVRMGSQSSVPVRPEILELIQLGRLPEESCDETPDGLLERWEELLSMVVAPVLREEADLLVTLFPKGSCFGIGWTLLHLIETARGWPIEETLAQCTSHEWRERMASRAALPASTP